MRRRRTPPLLTAFISTQRSSAYAVYLHLFMYAPVLMTHGAVIVAVHRRLLCENRRLPRGLSRDDLRGETRESGKGSLLHHVSQGRVPYLGSSSRRPLLISRPSSELLGHALRLLLFHRINPLVQGGRICRYFLLVQDVRGDSDDAYGTKIWGRGETGRSGTTQSN